jgi:glutathione synthase/RimK-type ligase-like ATP-grasp enzyme
VILFYGFGDEHALARAVEAARALDVRHVVVDQRHAAQHEVVLEFGPAGVEGSLAVAGTVVRLSDVTAVYARPLTPLSTADLRADQRARALHEAMLDWLDVAECLVVNRPSAMHSNASKPFQAQEIAAAGLQVPDTLVTNEPQRVREFWVRRRDIVFKSTSGVRSIVRRLDDVTASKLDKVRALPTQFQEYVRGVDVRVHVVGERIIATEVRTRAVDYRYADRDGLLVELTPIELPANVADRCLVLAERLDLPFCGIDLRRRDDGSHVCLEVNPMPGYSYFESETGQPISKLLVELLAGVAC